MSSILVLVGVAVIVSGGTLLPRWARRAGERAARERTAGARSPRRRART